MHRRTHLHRFIFRANDPNIRQPKDPESLQSRVCSCSCRYRARCDLWASSINPYQTPYAPWDKGVLLPVSNACTQVTWGRNYCLFYITNLSKDVFGLDYCRNISNSDWMHAHKSLGERNFCYFYITNYLRMCLVWILVKIYLIQIFSGNVSDDESKSLSETVWLINHILVY